MKPLEQMGRYATVVIDPPWPTGGFWSREAQHGTVGPHFHAEHTYPTMGLADIAALPVRQTLADDAWLFVWTTSAMLPDTFKVIEKWGIRYSFTMTWHKHIGPKPSGLPYYNVEYVVVGKVGKPRFTDVKAFYLANKWKHPHRDDPHPNAWGKAVYLNSGKPPDFYELLCRVTPAPRLDIFGRRRIAGFCSWGNEAPEGEALPDHYQQVLMDA